MKSFFEFVGFCRGVAIAPILLCQLAAPLLLIESSDAQDASTESVPQVGPEPLLTPSEQQLAQITDVVLTELEDGLQVVLVTSDPSLVEVFQFQEQNTLVVDIAGAELALPSATYQQLNPVPTVASLTLEQRGNEVQMTIVSAGETALNAYLERLANALQLDIVTTVLGETDPDLEFEGSGNLRIIVAAEPLRSEEHTSELQSPVPISYAVFCLKKKNKKQLNIPI